MRTILILILLNALFLLTGYGQTEEQEMNFNKLTTEEERVILHKGTELPWTGEYVDTKDDGTYTCKRCGAALYKSDDKFDSHCGWPSFDDEIDGAVKRIPDADGMRTEIVCARCGAHLGHVFEGEHFTSKNIRHCVNSISLNFVPDKNSVKMKTDTAIFAGGCFWGMEYYFMKEPGVVSVSAGYIGGHTKNPTYEQVCSHTTGHAEAIEVIFDPEKTTYEKLAKLFFEIHDPTQLDRQGPDVGDQYRSEVFYLDDKQKMIAEKLIGILKEKGYDVVTKVTKATTFWKAENYHQEYYKKTGGIPYCHSRTNRF
jgi:peptide methionine sulfoxide reductase msrA/msrB